MPPTVNFLPEQFSKTLLGSVPLRCVGGQLNHQKCGAVNTGARDLVLGAMAKYAFDISVILVWLTGS